MKNVVIATANPGKFEEIRAILIGEFGNFYSLKDFKDPIEVKEDSPLYLENVLKKARKIGDRFNMNTIADDSGIEVFALNGRPGVFSSRYGKDDEDRINKMLIELEGVPWEKRGAVFKAYIALYMPEKQWSYVFYGSLRGYIGLTRRGKGGFGYDPVFYVPEADKYAAELTMEEKNRLSHRGKALCALKEFLNSDFFRNPTAVT
ncbi:MAG: RdgB/HAM1 family non-canonical purine NTP pyrophosphatase [Proteobacteria bacterium]|nr:RdgB/HAM1 family non-canonical purine NTP pyrophosphatase [Pseudomonadota bacterium]